MGEGYEERVVGMTDFLIDTSLWLKKAPLIVTLRGKPRYRVDKVIVFPRKWVFKEEEKVKGEVIENPSKGIKGKIVSF